MQANIPLNVLNVINDERWKGSKLIMLKDDHVRPSAEELGRNSVWLKPICQYSPKKVRGLKKALKCSMQVLYLSLGASTFLSWFSLLFMCWADRYSTMNIFVCMRCFSVLGSPYVHTFSGEGSISLLPY